MKAQTHFKDLEIGQEFSYLGRTFSKTAVSLAVDCTNDEFIFMAEIRVEPLEIEECYATEDSSPV